MEDGWYGNGGYFTTCIPYSQHYIGGIKADESLQRWKDPTNGILLPKVGNTVFIFGALIKPGKVSIVEGDPVKAGPYQGKYRNKPKDPGFDSHMAYVAPLKYAKYGFRPVASRATAGA